MIREVHVPGVEDFDDVESLLALAASPGIRPGLERVRRLLELLGNPQDDYAASRASADIRHIRVLRNRIFSLY